MAAHGETLESQESINDRLATALEEVAGHNSEASAEQPMDEELQQELSAKLEGLYKDYYQARSGGKTGPETLLDESIARPKFFSLVDRYLTARALYGLAEKEDELPESMTKTEINKQADETRRELASLYADSGQARDVNLGGSGRTQDVHRFVSDPQLPQEAQTLLNGDLAEDLKIAAVDGDVDYIRQFRTVIKEHGVGTGE